MTTAAQKVLNRIQFLGSTPAKFGLDVNGDTVTVTRYYQGPMRRYRVVRNRENGFTVSMDSASSVAVADHVNAAMA
jgi:hypothetical protein